MTKQKKLQISLIGPNASGCTEDIYQLGLELGKALAKRNHTLVCGGMGGFMEAVAKGCSDVDCGQTVGILPTNNKTNSNPYLDIILPTGLGIARNVLVVNAGDIIIAVGGGAGTLSEIALAWQLSKTVICYTNANGWSAQLAGVQIDNRRKHLLLKASTKDEILSLIDQFVDENFDVS